MSRVRRPSLVASATVSVAATRNRAELGRRARERVGGESLPGEGGDKTGREDEREQQREREHEPAHDAVPVAAGSERAMLATKVASPPIAPAAASALPPGRPSSASERPAKTASPG